MAKSKTLTLEQIDQQIQAILQRRGEQLTIIEAAQKQVTLLHKTLKSLQAMRVAHVPLTLETALETYLDTGENTPGYEWLNDRTWKGDWKDSGFGAFGLSWNETNQRVLGLNFSLAQVRVNMINDREAIVDRLERLIMEVVPAVKEGALGKNGARLKTMSKGASVDLREVKVFSINHGQRRLGVDRLGTWMVFDENHYGFKRADLTGTLRECLDLLVTMGGTSEDGTADDGI